MGGGIRKIGTERAPAAIGPYSQAVEAGGFVFCSGQIPLDPATGQMVQGIAAQTRRVLENLRSVLEAAGSDLSRVVRCTVFLKDLGQFQEMNTVYAEFFEEPYPSRAAVEVSRLPKDAGIEIDAVALAAHES